jgi:hypothetical protein
VDEREGTPAQREREPTFTDALQETSRSASRR